MLPMRKIKKRKANKVVRYAKASRRSVRRMTRKKVIDWFNNNLKGHPFISGFLFFVWISLLLDLFLAVRSGASMIKAMLRIDGIIFMIWLVMVVLSNALRDKQKVKWYFRKRLVFFLMFLFYPLGLIFLWSGAKFKNVTKVVLTVIFGLIFIGNVVYQEKIKRDELKGTPFDRVAKVFNAPKKKVNLPAYAPDSASRLKISKQESRHKLKLTISEIHARYSPSVVSIKTKDKLGRELGLGSGFVISRDGFIATNYHVVESAYQAEVKIGEQLYAPVYLVKAIAQKDIAILKIEADDLLPLPIGNSDQLISGQIVVALGSPLGLEKSISSGIVSSMRSGRDIKLIQMTVPVSPGSSGGPVFNEYGEVVGITTLASFFLAQNVNFAVPIGYLENIINQKK